MHEHRTSLRRRRCMRCMHLLHHSRVPAATRCSNIDYSLTLRSSFVCSSPHRCVAASLRRRTSSLSLAGRGLSEQHKCAAVGRPYMRGSPERRSDTALPACRQHTRLTSSRHHAPSIIVPTTGQPSCPLRGRAPPPYSGGGLFEPAELLSLFLLPRGAQILATIINK